MQSEYFICENCQRNIPTINRTVHAVRCVAMPEVQSSFNCSSSSDSSETASWLCSRCTFSNTEHAQDCEICGTSRNHNILDIDNERISSYDNQPSTERCCSDQGHNQSQWQCLSCTYLNLQLSEVCMMCQNPRPPISTVRETLLPSYTESQELFDELATDHDNTLFNRSWSRSSTDNNSLEDGLDNTAGSMLLGAGLGASLAWLNNSDITNGALTGAGLGVLGDLLRRELNQQFPRTSSRVQEISSESISNETPGIYIPASRMDNILRQMALAHQQSRILNRRRSVNSPIVDVDIMSFEELLAHFPQPVRGVEDDVLASLPVRTYCRSAVADSSSTSARSCGAGVAEDEVGLTAKTSCSICLEEYQSGEEVKTLPCLHCYHSTCVDHWLRQHRTCPICKHVIDRI